MPRGFFAKLVMLVLGASACDVVLGLDEDRRLEQPGGGAEVYEEAVLADEPLAYFRFEEPAPYADSIVPSRVLVVNGAGVASVPGAVGQGLQFDGGVADLGSDDFRFSDDAPMTIEVWASTTGIKFQDVVGKYQPGEGGGDQDKGYGLRVDPENGSLTWLYTRADNGFRQTRGRPADESIRHVVVTFDGSISRVYVDGSLVEAKDGGSVGTHQEPFRLGGLGNPFFGTLDELALYDKALPAERVRAHFEARPK